MWTSQLQRLCRVSVSKSGKVILSLFPNILQIVEVFSGLLKMLKKILSLQIGRVLYEVYKLDTDLKQIRDHPKISYHFENR